jgi:hypothetical protein
MRPSVRNSRRLAALAALLGAGVLLGGCGGSPPDEAVVQAADAPTPTVSTAEPTPTATRAPLPDRADAASTKHPDPCGVDNDRDMIERRNHFFEAPAGRVEAAAEKLFGGRFLGVYIANVPQQYGVGVGVHELTPADEDAFFDATCFRRGDVVFETGPVSDTQLRAWRAEAETIMFGKGKGGCSLSHDWRTGRVEVGIKEGHPQLREELEHAIPAENLAIVEGNCPVPL